MSINTPPPSPCPPWEIGEQIFREAEGGDFIFKAIQLRGRGAQGVIIAAWEGEHPTSYLNDEVFSIFNDFGDPTKSESPKMYVTLKGALKTLDAIRNRKGRWGDSIEPPPRVGLCYWTHPDAHFQPLYKYQKLLSQFPGCPRH